MADRAEDPDLDLVLPAMGGDLDAFEALVRRYQRRIVSLGRSLAGDAGEAEDLAQEVFVRVYKALPGFRRESAFRTWIYKVAVNLARSRQARRRRQEGVWVDSGADETTVFDPPDARNFEAEWVTRESIDRALESLPEELRVSVTLRDVHGLEYKEIAETLSIPIGTVESRIFRARQRLRTALAASRDVGNERSSRRGSA